jgi:hypothetical protein
MRGPCSVKNEFMGKNAAVQIISGTEYKSRKWGPFGEHIFFKAVIQRALFPTSSEILFFFH